MDSLRCGHSTRLVDTRREVILRDHGEQIGIGIEQGLERPVGECSQPAGDLSPSPGEGV